MGSEKDLSRNSLEAGAPAPCSRISAKKLFACGSGPCGFPAIGGASFLEAGPSPLKKNINIFFYLNNSSPTYTTRCCPFLEIGVARWLERTPPGHWRKGEAPAAPSEASRTTAKQERGKSAQPNTTPGNVPKQTTKWISGLLLSRSRLGGKGWHSDRPRSRK